MKKRMQKGFSLIEMSVVLTIISVVIAGVLPGLTSMNKSRELEITNQRMKAIEDALLAFRLANDRLPCPASIIINEGTANFGVEGANPGTCTGGAPAANWTLAGADGGRGGAVPVRTLDLPDEYTYDGWGRKFTYNVDRRLTAASAFTTYPPTSAVGTYNVAAADNTDLATPANDMPRVRTLVAAYVLWSAGPDGHGGFTANGVRFNRGITNAETLVNCNCTSAGAAAPYTKVLVQRARWTDPANSLNQFDDIVTYKLRSQIETSTVLGSDLWSVNGTTNLYPTTLARNVTIGQSANTATLTNPSSASHTAKLTIEQPTNSEPSLLTYSTNQNSWVMLNDGSMTVQAYAGGANNSRAFFGQIGEDIAGGTSNIVYQAINRAPQGSFTAHLDNPGPAVGSRTTGTVYGIYNRVTGDAEASSEMRGVFSQIGTNTTTAASANVVHNIYAVNYANAATQYAMRGVITGPASASTSAYGVSGAVEGGAHTTGYGVWGRVTSNSVPTAYGVFGELTAAASGTTVGAGVRGATARTGTYGVYGSATAASAMGVRGEASGASSYGVHGLITGSGIAGVRGNGDVANGYGVWGFSNGATSYAVNGESEGSGLSYGVRGTATSATGYGVYCHAAANANGCGGNRAWYNASDARLKTNVKELGDADGLEALRKLTPVRYVWDQVALAGKPHLGFIAQDVQKIYPELVGEGPDQEITRLNGTKDKVKHALTMSYAEVTVPLVKAVQQLDGMFSKLMDSIMAIKASLAELMKRVDGHESEIKALKAENAELKKRLDTIERKLEALPAKP